MVDHFHDQVIGCLKIGGQARAMVVTDGIQRAIRYFHSFEEYLEERKSPYRAVVAFSGEHEYGGRRVTEASLNGFPSGKIADRIREDPYRFLVCADKFQTGSFRHLLAERAHDRLWVAVNNGQQNTGGAVWHPAPLFPILQRTRIEAKPVRELLATQLHTFPQRQNVFCSGIVNNAARKSDFAAHVCKNLAQGCFYLSTHLGSFRCHLFASSFLIAATSRDRTFRSAGVKSSRSALA